MPLELPLETDRLRLRGLPAAGAQALSTLGADAELRSLLGARARPEHLRIVEDRASGQVLGYAGLQPLAHGDETELVCGVIRSARGQGIATEAAGALLEAGFRDMALPRVTALADPQNEPARRALAKLGFGGEASFWDGVAKRDVDYFARGPGLPTPPARYRVRRAEPAECEQLGDIEAAADERFADTPLGTPDFFDGPVTPTESFRHGLQARALWVAAPEGGAPVGFALFERSGDRFHLEELDVHPDHGRQRLGSRLVRAVLAQAFEESATAVTLTTFRDIPWNAPFYFQLGFEELPESAWPPGMAERVAGEDERGLRRADRLVMQRSLLPRPA